MLLEIKHKGLLRKENRPDEENEHPDDLKADKVVLDKSMNCALGGAKGAGGPNPPGTAHQDDCDRASEFTACQEEAAKE